VNADGQLAPIDALLIINELNSGRSSDLPRLLAPPESYLDANADGVLSAIDALFVINELNAPVGEGEPGTGAKLASDRIGLVPYLADLAFVEPNAHWGRGLTSDAQERVLGSKTRATLLPRASVTSNLPLGERACGRRKGSGVSRVWQEK
jgi:hypothetical protein